MPKRSLDVSTPVDIDLERVQKKTERSHEENQERAYIAASRRADRSIEARVQSARMASEIHKKRTGKGFKISEEIVLKEEMYEEEEDDLPRQYRALAAHLRTSSEDMNSRVNAYITNQVAMRTLARHQEVNRMFSESFPNAPRVSQQLAQSLYYQPLQEGRPGTSAPQFHSLSHSPPHPFPHDRSRSLPHVTPLSPRRASLPQLNVAPMQVPLSMEERLSTPALTPASGNSETPRSHSPSTFAAHPPPYALADAGQTATAPMPDFIDPSLAPVTTSPQMSSFTSELPQETKMLANIDITDPLAPALYGFPADTAAAEVNVDSYAPTVPMTNATFPTKEDPVAVPDLGFMSGGLQLPNRYSDFPTQGSRIGTPGGGDGDSWEAWLNTDEIGVFDG
ncbi:hypothetical protein VTK73DRAFT_9674 [Phialemonium thermophilum]|uniref:Uncharacterized protein n=1 Tax=Phialemonium thermophilum TaxID=223376 RepID=A0ABR3XJ29_9PEZI